MENCVQSKIREKISHINNSEEQLYMMAKQPRDNNTNSRFDTNERNTAKKEQRVERKKRNCTHSTKGGKRIVAKFEMRIQKTKKFDTIPLRFETLEYESIKTSTQYVHAFQIIQSNA